MENDQLQLHFFNYLKEILPSHLSLADELCDILELSPDSAYRRIRGEKPISLLELKLICEKYKMSLDQVLQLKNDSVVFQVPDVARPYGSMDEYLKGLLGHLKFFNQFKEKKMLYLCKDIPVWNFYLFPEIASFKTFFWLKSILNHPDYAHRQYSLSEHPFESCFLLGQEMIKEYNQIPCLELWNHESLNSTINQLAFCQESGVFKNENDMDLVLDSLMKSLDHWQAEAERGVKFLPGGSTVTYKAAIQLYVNEVILGNNTILGEADGNRMSFITHTVLSYLVTRDTRFNDHMFSNFETLRSRATLISATGDKDRNRFFNSLRQKVTALRRTGR